MFDLEREIQTWKGRLGAKGKIRALALDELESHLRDEVDELSARGLAADEAFLIAIKRIGNLDAIAGEFGRGATEELWKRLVLSPEGLHSRFEARRDIVLTAVLALLAGLCAKIPDLFGFGPMSGEDPNRYALNAALFCLPFVTAGFLVVRKAGWKASLAYAFFFSLPALALNLFPWANNSATQVLSIIHLPFVFWLGIIPAYCGPSWRDSNRRMDFLRMTGEIFLYAVLILCGVGVLSAFIIALLGSIKIEASGVVMEWVLIMGGFASPVIASRLAQAKRNVIENIAPVLARIFGPLFLAAMIVFLGVMAFTGRNPLAEREVLIGFDLMLALVLALVLYSMSARDGREAPAFSDYVNTGLALTALLINGFALTAILGRIGSFGFSPNKVAALGENLILCVNLAGLAFLHIRYFIRRKDYDSVLRWQTALLPVLFLWTLVVALGFPLMFAFA